MKVIPTAATIPNKTQYMAANIGKGIDAKKSSKLSKYREEEHESSWNLHRSPAPYVCQSKQANIFDGCCGTDSSAKNTFKQHANTLQAYTLAHHSCWRGSSTWKPCCRKIRSSWLCRRNNCCSHHSKDMARSEYGFTPLKRVRESNPRSRCYKVRAICTAILFSLLFGSVISTSLGEDSSKWPYKPNAEKQSKPLEYIMASRKSMPQILLSNDKQDQHRQTNLHTVSEKWKAPCKRTKTDYTNHWHDNDWTKKSCEVPPCPTKPNEDVEEGSYNKWPLNRSHCSLKPLMFTSKSPIRIIIDDWHHRKGKSEWRSHHCWKPCPDECLDQSVYCCHKQHRLNHACLVTMIPTHPRHETSGNYNYGSKHHNIVLKSEYECFRPRGVGVDAILKVVELLSRSPNGTLRRPKRHLRRPSNHLWWRRRSIFSHLLIWFSFTLPLPYLFSEFLKTKSFFFSVEALTLLVNHQHHIYINGLNWTKVFWVWFLPSNCKERKVKNLNKRCKQWKRKFLSFELNS